ncbi:MAG: putative sulfate exporter family transporter [Actinomycetota bacterium]|nr:putative sulfate exporter family transporter [Actinomycetota bacterium]
MAFDATSPPAPLPTADVSFDETRSLPGLGESPAAPRQRRTGRVLERASRVDIVERTRSAGVLERIRPVGVVERVAGTVRRVVPGLLPATAIGLAAYGVGRVVPEVGGPVVAVVGGIAVATLLGHRPAWAPGIRVGTHQLLKLAIVLLGFGISLGMVWTTVRSSGLVMLGTLTAGLVAAVVVGRLLGVRGDRQTLVGVGTAICGASAIAATAGVLEPDDDDVAYAITVIFVFNVAAVLTFPLLARALHMGGGTFGLWAGTAVNDMSSVVAATSVFGHGSLHTGVVVKLARTLMILPVTAALAVHRRRRARATTAVAAGLVDAGQVDGGQVDGGLLEIGRVDIGRANGGLVDGGLLEAGQVDGGLVVGGQVDGGLVVGGRVAPALVTSVPGGEPPVAAPNGRGTGRSLLHTVPLFLVFFLLASLLRSVGAVDAGLASGSGQASLVVITIALAAVGLSARPDHIRAAGLRPLAFGAVLWIVLASTSLGLQAMH